MHRFDVRSADGTSLAVWVEGDGPPLVMVHGSVADHTTLAPLAAELGNDMAVFSMDRRGFGASGDAPAYTIDRDFDDVAAVVDAVAARSGGPVALFGHSYGASCAMGGAARTQNVHHLVLYEPSLGLTYPTGSIEAVEEAVDEGDLDAAVVAMFGGVLELTEEQIDAMRGSATPSWETRIASAWTMPRECRVEQTWVYAPGQFDAIEAPTLLLAGSETTPDLSKATREAADALAGARIQVLEGHGHLAHKTDPAMVSAIIRQFISSRAS